MNRNTIVTPDIGRCCARALELFMEESGVKKEGPKYEKMREDAFRIRDEIKGRVDIRGVYSYYGNYSLVGQTLEIGGETFRCTAFEQMDPDSIEGVYFYAVAAGEYSMPERPIMDQLYADIWGTAFTDSIREEVMGVLNEKAHDEGKWISDSFGPGFYGMDVAEMRKMPKFVDFEHLGLEIRESGVMLPLKSCAGIIFKVNEKYERLYTACQHCFGSRKTCTLCAMLGQKK